MCRGGRRRARDRRGVPWARRRRVERGRAGLSENRLSREAAGADGALERLLDRSRRRRGRCAAVARRAVGAPNTHSNGRFTLMSPYQAAVDWVEAQAELMVHDGKWLNCEVYPSEVFLRLQLGIKRHHPNNALAVNTFDCSEEAANSLSKQAFKGDAGAVKLCLVIVDDRIKTGEPVPYMLRDYACLFLLGRIQAPRGQRRRMTWLRAQALLFLARQVAKDFGLPRTRNEGSPPISACDAVSEGFARCDARWTSF